ncbi:xanthine dehydrogenase family protein molybdopterin-binding subunit [Sneathiella limimaris]|uniref:xanthine dehydrogenase family protein molybdopterin-binding subunit n=1 Tax=Sneathiella limimaris TaxID=1964213 RepID=UPI0019D2DCB6|nr:xanthine dehydrogenase family protein molybdopterin-binding subunit [Sneathiella limimaris]
MNMIEKMLSAKEAPVNESRRNFLKVSGGVTAGLVIGFSLSGLSTAEAMESKSFNPFVQIAPDGTVTVMVKHLDKGQGTFSGLLTLVADELDVPWENVKGEYAPANAELYNNLFFGAVQGTGGSTGIPNSFMQYRTAGATAREMLKLAGAKRFGQNASDIRVENGVVSGLNGKSATYGELAAEAATMPVPEKPVLKTPDQFKYIGNQSHRRIDTPAKTRGEFNFTQDVQLPGMLVAVIARPPRFGATAKSMNKQPAMAIKGVQEIVQVPQGVAVLASNTWAAFKGREALEVEWDLTQAESRSTADLKSEYEALAEKPGKVVVQGQDLDSSFAKATKVLEATFEFPYLAHAPMEPVNAVADLKPGKSLDVWTGSQMQTGDHYAASQISGLTPDKVNIHTLSAGGSFGRRATPTSDMVSEAVAIAKAINGRAPVKLIWSREDDIRGGYYRPMYVHKVKAGLDEKGDIVAWHHRIVGQSILQGTAFEQVMVKDGIDMTSVEGAVELPYQVGNHQLELHTVKVGVPVLWWRSVGSTHTAYAVETMMDRLAKAAGKDPVEFRLERMQNSPREAAALKLAAEKANWGKAELPAGVHRGVAVHKSFGSHVAEIAEVRLNDDGTIKVERVFCAIDCGIAVTPDQVAAQMEGGVGYGLGAILRNQITMTDGEVEQSQFFDFEPLRISDMPHVETHIVPSDAAPSGVGEPGTPPIGPAVANAIFWGTGREIDKLPFSQHGLV